MFQLMQTEDGSWSCLDETTGEWCHNRTGAYTEAYEHYVKPSRILEHLPEFSQFKVLDVCFGLGYNTWTLIQEMLRVMTQPCIVSVVAIESNPEILRLIPIVLNDPTFDTLKFETHHSEHNTYYRTQYCIFDTKFWVDPPSKIEIPFKNGLQVHIHLIQKDVRAVVPVLDGPFGAIFHDAFSPAKMPELWTIDLFQLYQHLLKPDSGRVITYSAAAAVRGAFIEAGFKVAKTGPLGQKAGGTVAFLSGDAPDLAPISPEELAYIQSRAGIPYRDPQLQDTREQVLSTRTAEQQASSRASGEALRHTLKKHRHSNIEESDRL